MNKVKLLLLALGMTATTASAGVIFSVENAGQMTSTQAGVNTVNFNDGTTGSYTDSSVFSDYTIYNTPSGTGQSASPYGINDSFLSVPNPNSSGTAEFGLGADYNYFGLFWGSVDSYNTLRFYDDGSLVGSFGGDDISPPLAADGGQGDWDSNRYVNFFFTNGDMYDTIRLTSTNYAFETDNHAFGNVPEPSIIALFGLGLLGLGFARRRKA